MAKGAELAVRLVDKINEDPYLDVRCTKRGDVIVVVEQGWKWGKKELENPEWGFFYVPASVHECMQLLSPELPQTPTPDRMLRKRAFSFDIEAYEAGERDIKKLIVTKKRLEDPRVLGEDVRVIG